MAEDGGASGIPSVDLIPGRAAIVPPYSHADAPAYSFGLKVVKNLGDDIPGPGSYDVTRPVASIHKTLEDRRVPASYRPHKKTDEFIGTAGIGSPGPGSYSIPGCFDGVRRARTIGTSERWAISGSTGVGPGSYGYGGGSVQGKGAPWAMSRTPRFGRSSGGDVPGPAEYDQRSSLRTRTSVFGRMTERRETNRVPVERKNVPGPGSYDTDSPRTIHSGKAFSFKIRVPVRSENGVPGPGSYDVRGSMNTGRSISLRGPKTDVGLKTVPTEYAYEFHRLRHGQSAHVGRPGLASNRPNTARF